MQSVINTATAATVRQVSHTSVHTNAHLHYLCVCVCAQLHTYKHMHTKMYTQVQMCALLRHAFTHNSRTDDSLPPPPPSTNTRFNNEVEKLFVCRSFFWLSLSVFYTSASECTQTIQRIKGENKFTAGSLKKINKITYLF